MTPQKLHYKGYTTRIKYVVEDDVFYGKIDNVKDLVTFESVYISDIEEEFHKAVDDYIEFKKDKNL